MPNLHQTQLLALLSRALFGNALSVEIGTADYSEILKEACLHSVAPLALDGVPDAEVIPEQIRTKWRGYVFRAYRGNCRMFAEHARLHERLTAAGIPYCILKGVASAAFYEKPDLRMMGDVDFLVAHADLERTVDYFDANGYGKPAICDHHYGYEKDGVKVELHFEIPGRPAGEMGVRLSRYTDSLLADAGLVTDSFGSYVLPSDFHHGLILLLHMQEHIATSGIGLRHLCDYAVFVNRYTDAEFRALFEDALSDLGLLFFAQIAARTAHRYLGLPFCEWMGNGDPAIEDTLIEDILSAGNFGKKDTSRYQAGFLLSHSRDGKRHGLIYRLFAGINTYLRGRYKLFRKMPIFLPLGWPLYFWRYFLLLLRGKRKLKLTKIAKGTREHESLYYSLRLFEAGPDKK